MDPQPLARGSLRFEASLNAIERLPINERIVPAPDGRSHVDDVADVVGISEHRVNPGARHRPRNPLAARTAGQSMGLQRVP